MEAAKAIQIGLGISAAAANERAAELPEATCKSLCTAFTAFRSAVAEILAAPSEESEGD